MVPGRRELHRPPPIAYVTMFLFGLLVAAGAHALRNFAIECNQREVLRVSSPDGTADAVLVEPLVSWFGEAPSLYLVPRGDSAPAWGAVARVSSYGEVPMLDWASPQLLEMRLTRGCIESFSNVWHSSDIEDGNYYVEIRVDPESALTCIQVPPPATLRSVSVQGAGAAAAAPGGR